MLSPAILVPAVLNGLMTGAVYALVALGLTLIYGVLHIINFAHGALLTAAMFAAFFAHRLLGLDPYLAAIVLTPLFFVLGYGLAALRHRPGSARRGPQHPAGHARARGRDRERPALRVPCRHPHDQSRLRLQRRRPRHRLPRRAARRRLRRRGHRGADPVAGHAAGPTPARRSAPSPRRSSAPSCRASTSRTSTR